MNRPLIVALILLVFGWGTYVAAGPQITAAIANRAGKMILKFGEGKMDSSTNFVNYRIIEALELSTLLFIWASIHFAVASWQQKHAPLKRWRWLTQAAVGFICLNLWLAEATKTALFWGLMWEGQNTQNLTRFELKLILAKENMNTTRAVLVGSSQTRAQIDEQIINSELGALLQTAELHFPGSKAYDVFLLQPTIAKIRPRYVICYITEAYFHSGSASDSISNFLTISDLYDLYRRGGFSFISANRIGTGLLGQILPVFRLRQVLSQRLFGTEISHLKQAQYNAALEADLPERARSVALDCKINDESRFHQKALEDFVHRCQRDHQQVLLLVGQLNPLFVQAVDPAIRSEMLRFLHALADKNENVTLVENLPLQNTGDYEDLTHVTKSMQEKFTVFFTEWLRALITKPH